MGTLLNPNIGIRWKLQCGVDPLSVGPIPCIKQAERPREAVSPGLQAELKSQALLETLKWV